MTNLLTFRAKHAGTIQDVAAGLSIVLFASGAVMFFAGIN